MQQKPKLPYVATTSFVVGNNDLDIRSALQLCRLLTVANKHSDEAICAMVGSLDYNKIGASHYNMDIVGTAVLNDEVTIRTYAWYSDNALIEVLLEVYITNGNKQQIIMNGSFVFTVKKAAPVYKAAA